MSAAIQVLERMVSCKTVAAQGQGEDQLGDQDRLHDGQLPVVESDGLEHEGATHEEKADQPTRVAHQGHGTLPALLVL